MAQSKRWPSDDTPEGRIRFDSLMRFYEQSLPEFMFPVSHISRLTDIPVQDILSMAQTLGLCYNIIYPELTGQHVAEIIRELFRLEENHEETP